MANTYSQLVTDITNLIEDSGDEFAAWIPRSIALAELRLVKDLDDEGLNVYTSVAVSAGTAQVTLPSATRIVRNFSVNIGGSAVNLKQRTTSFIKDYWPVSTSTSTPVYYARRGNTQITIAPTPTSTSDGEVTTVQLPATLSTGNATNYFTDFCYDLLLYAALVEVMMFIKNYSQVDRYNAHYKGLLDLQRNEARRSRRDDIETPANPAGGADPLVANSS